MNFKLVEAILNGLATMNARILVDLDLKFFFSAHLTKTSIKELKEEKQQVTLVFQDCKSVGNTSEHLPLSLSSDLLHLELTVDGYTIEDDNYLVLTNSKENISLSILIIPDTYEPNVERHTDKKTISDQPNTTSLDYPPAESD